MHHSFQIAAGRCSRSCGLPRACAEDFARCLSAVVYLTGGVEGWRYLHQGAVGGLQPVALPAGEVLRADGRSVHKQRPVGRESGLTRNMESLRLRGKSSHQSS